MNVRQYKTRVVVAAPAKLNFTLEVLGKRDDGFHDLETLISPISLYDQVSFDALENGTGGQFALAVDGANAPPGEDNLVLRAARLLAKRAGVDRGANMTLLKRIPSEAGLGGGSSDAAATLVAANLAWGLNWPASKLAALGAELGSDIPCFFAGGGAICTGRGERVRPVALPAGIPLVVVKPDAGLATGDVFRAWREQANEQNVSSAAGVVDALRSGNLAQLRRHVRNTLQAPALALSSAVRDLQQVFASLPLVAHQMTGSGSAWFGICRSWKEATRWAEYIGARQAGQAFAVATCR